MAKRKRIICEPLSAEEICKAVGVTEEDRRIVDKIFAKIRKKPRG